MWGAVRGGGHGSIAEGPNGQLWCFYTVNVGYEGDMERRLGADPAYVTEDGVLVVPHLSEIRSMRPACWRIPAAKRAMKRVRTFSLHVRVMRCRAITRAVIRCTLRMNLR